MAEDDAWRVKVSGLRPDGWRRTRRVGGQSMRWGQGGIAGGMRHARHSSGVGLLELVVGFSATPRDSRPKSAKILQNSMSPRNSRLSTCPWPPQIHASSIKHRVTRPANMPFSNLNSLMDIVFQISIAVSKPRNQGSASTKTRSVPRLPMPPRPEGLQMLHSLIAARAVPRAIWI